MEICILYETEFKGNKVEWEELKEPTEMEKITTEKAGSLIIDHKIYIS